MIWVSLSKLKQVDCVVNGEYTSMQGVAHNHHLHCFSEAHTFIQFMEL